MQRELLLIDRQPSIVPPVYSIPNVCFAFRYQLAKVGTKYHVFVIPYLIGYCVIDCCPRYVVLACAYVE